jgi:hypothetical protein
LIKGLIMQPKANLRLPIAMFFLRTTQQARVLVTKINTLAEREVCSVDHTIVYFYGLNKAQASALFKLTHESFDEFNNAYIENANTTDWLERYQAERSMGVCAAKLVECDNHQDAIDEFRISYLSGLHAQLEGTSIANDGAKEISQALLCSNLLGLTIEVNQLETTIEKLNTQFSTHDFINYDDLFEDVVRPISMRSLKNRDTTAYKARANQLIGDYQSKKKTLEMQVKSQAFESFLGMLNSQHNHSDNAQLAMHLTTTYLALKTAYVKNKLLQDFFIIGNKPLLSVEGVLKPIKTHRASCATPLLAKIA